jgi:hypothetical protein
MVGGGESDSESEDLQREGDPEIGSLLTVLRYFPL